MIALGGILSLPDAIDAILFDMDGVILDTLGGDHSICVAAASDIVGRGDWVSKDAVATHFALEPDAFWRELEKQSPTPIDQDTHDAIVAAYDQRRSAAAFPILPGIEAILRAARDAGLKTAVASSNDENIVELLTERAGLSPLFDAVAGIADQDVRPKPSPDIYQRAAEMVGVDPSRCAFIEDSATGLTAGQAAGCGYAVAVSTGALPFDAIDQLDRADVVYDRFSTPSIAFHDGAPARKNIDTPNDFVSHMIEHIAWRMGTGIDIHWRNNDWRALGLFLGRGLGAFDLSKGAAATLGMIDDGAAEVLIDRSGSPGVEFSTHHSLPRDQVLSMRVEQVRVGQHLVRLADGLAHGLDAKLDIRLCTFEDPHHSWEGVFRAIGIALARLRNAS